MIIDVGPLDRYIMNFVAILCVVPRDQIEVLYKIMHLVSCFWFLFSVNANKRDVPMSRVRGYSGKM